MITDVSPRSISAPPTAVWDELEFRVEPTAAGTRLSTETCVTVTDPRTRRLFAPYRFFIRPGSSAIRREVLRVAGDRAESPRTPPGPTANA